MDALSCLRPHGSSFSLPFPRCGAFSGASDQRRINPPLRAIGLGFQRNPFDQRVQSCRRKCDIPLLVHRTSHARRNASVRSELTASAGSSDFSTYSQTGSQLGSKVRGICFYIMTAVAAIPLFVAMMLVHPFVILFDRHRRTAHHLIAKAWASLTISPFYKVEIEGVENLPRQGTPAVYVSNHQSFLDIYTLLTLGTSFKFISKRAIFLFPIIGWAMYLMGLIPLRRMDSRSQLDCLKRCMNLTKKGASVFFFPEGTRSKNGKLGSFKKGAFTVAAKTGVPVVPITLLGTGKLMPAAMEGFLNEGSVKVMIHKPIEGSDADALCNESRNTIANTLLLHGYGVDSID